MIYGQYEKHGIAIVSQSVATNATATANIDTRGYRYLSVDIQLDSAAAVSSNPATLKLSESDDTVVSNFADIAAFVGDGASGFTIPDADTDDPQLVRFNVDLRGRKRYIRLTLTPAGAAQQVAANYHMSRADLGPTSASDAGCAALVNG